MERVDSVLLIIYGAQWLLKKCLFFYQSSNWGIHFPGSIKIQIFFTLTFE